MVRLKNNEAVPLGENGIILATELVGLLRGRNLTIATAESLTGGMLSSTIVAVPGASDVFRGGAVTYATETKHTVLGVDKRRLETFGPVDLDVAGQMASGAASLFKSDLALATTGVAGPDSQGGKPVGTAYIALYYKKNSPNSIRTCSNIGCTKVIKVNCSPSSQRQDIRLKVVEESLNLVKQFLLTEIIF